MYFSYQTLVLAALAFEAATAQPAHRHMHQHHPRALSDVLGKRDDFSWNQPSLYKNKATGKEFTPAEWACFSAGGTDATCLGGGSGSPSPASSSAPAPKVEEKLAEPAHKSSGPKPSQSDSPDSVSDSGTGAHVFNKGSETQTFTFYLNTDGGAGFGQATVPDEGRTITVDAGDSKFVPLPLSWKGHVQRAAATPTTPTAATWVELQIKDPKTNLGWGNISLQKGCDGAAQIHSPETGDIFGFEDDIINGAPDAAKVQNPGGKWALDYTEPGYRGTVNADRNQATIEWELKSHPGQEQAYIVGGDGTKVVQSSKGIFHVYFY